MNVRAQRAQAIPLQQYTLETTLEEGSVFLPEAIVASREHALKPLHAHAQVRFRRLQGQVVVISHNAVSMQDPAGPLTRLEKALLKRVFGSLVLEDPVAIVTPVHHVVERTSVFEAKRSWHRIEIKG